MVPGAALRHISPLLFAGLALLAGCSTAAPDERQALTVYAAASLTTAFAEIAAAYESEQPHAAVTLNLAGSQQLAQQLVQGAPADVFASAAEAPLKAAINADRIAPGTAQPFAANRLVVITPPGETAVQTVADLAQPGLRLVLAAATVPAGHYARTFLEKARADSSLGDGYEMAVLANVVSYEQNVRAVLTKVALGEAEAGIVYESDAAGAALRRIPIPEALNVTATYLIAPVSDSAVPELAAGFVRFVLSPAGQAILQRHGLLPAPAGGP